MQHEENFPIHGIIDGDHYRMMLKDNDGNHFRHWKHQQIFPDRWSSDKVSLYTEDDQAGD